MFIDPLLCDLSSIITAVIGAGALATSGAGAAGALGPKAPKPPTEKDTAEARRRRIEEMRRRRGRAASIVTGGAGLTNEPALGRPSLLGAA